MDFGQDICEVDDWNQGGKRERYLSAGSWICHFRVLIREINFGENYHSRKWQWGSSTSCYFSFFLFKVFKMFNRLALKNVFTVKFFTKVLIHSWHRNHQNVREYYFFLQIFLLFAWSKIGRIAPVFYIEITQPYPPILILSKQYTANVLTIKTTGTGNCWVPGGKICTIYGPVIITGFPRNSYSPFP